jgi:hypothetical protein
MGFGLRTRATTPRIAPARLHEIGVVAVLSPRLLTACALQGMQPGITALRATMRTPTVTERPD